MDRMTKAKLKTRLDWVNDALGVPRDPWVKTENGFQAVEGVIVLDWAYGGVRVCRMCGPSGGQSDLSPRGNMRQAAEYLEAMLEGIRLARAA